MNTAVKTPFVHITRRKNIAWYRAWIVRIIAIILALILCGIITTFVVHINPVEVYKTMITGNFGTARKVWFMGQDIATLLIISLALAPAFRMKFWNLGGDGQALMGCFGAAACMILFSGSLPNWLLLIVMFIAALCCGMLWAVLPAFFKAKWNTNETLFTLMMNYLATQLIAFFVVVWENPKGSSKIGIINQKTQLGWLPDIGGNKYVLIIIVSLILAAAMFIYMRYTKHGYEIAVVGESEPTARYVGIKVRKVIIRTMLLSGAICGLAGFLMVSSTNHTLTTTLVGGRGFTGVMVAWLAKFNPFFMILTSFLLVFLERGASEISTMFGFNDSFGAILTGIILFFIIGCEFFLNYEMHFRKSSKKEVA